MPLDVVYRAAPGDPTRAVLHALQSAGLDACALDPEEPAAQLTYASAGTYTVRIAVPTEQADAAAEILMRWQSRNASLVERQSRLFVHQLLLALLISAGTMTALLVLPRALQYGVWGLWPGWFLGAGWFLGTALGTLVALVVIAAVQERRQRRRGPGGPACEACGYPLLGLTEPRCPECGQPFNPRLLKRIRLPK